jgi:hypothetical protein
MSFSMERKLELLDKTSDGSIAIALLQATK